MLNEPEYKNFRWSDLLRLPIRVALEKMILPLFDSLDIRDGVYYFWFQKKERSVQIEASNHEQAVKKLVDYMFHFTDNTKISKTDLSSLPITEDGK